MEEKKIEMATLAGGCFWCTEAVYQKMKGVEKVVSGYAGGQIENPTYEQICSGTTGHAEVVQLTYNTSIVSFADLLEVFWKVHNPTTLNRQGADVGTQYRSAIFYHNEMQKQIAEKSIEALTEAAVWDDPIVTEITQLNNYYPAEAYHQNYMNLNGNKNPYCINVVGPKVEKFKQLFKDKLK